MATTTGAERAAIRMQAKFAADAERLRHAPLSSMTRQQRRAEERAVAKMAEQLRRAPKRKPMLIPKPQRQPKAHAYRTVVTGELRNGRERYLHVTKSYKWRVA